VLSCLSVGLDVLLVVVLDTALLLAFFESDVASVVSEIS